MDTNPNTFLIDPSKIEAKFIDNGLDGTININSGFTILKNELVEKIYKNNVLVLEINNNGLLSNKKLYTLTDTNDLDFTDLKTAKTDKNTFVTGVLTNLKQKIDSPKRRRSNSKKQ